MEKATAVSLSPLGENVLRRFARRAGSSAVAKIALRKLYRLRLTNDSPVTVEVVAERFLSRAVAPEVFALQLRSEWKALGCQEGLDYTLEVV